VAGNVNDDVVITASGLPEFQIAVPKKGQVGEGAFLHRALAMDVQRIDDEGHIIPLKD
jgi:hypothetical protein